MNPIKIKENEYKLYHKFVSQNLTTKKKENDDILSKYPLRLLAYSNEVGAAISPINNTLGTVLWAPALLYLGADIYDKYKNEDKTYNPSARRSIQQAIFQGLASVIMPTGAIKLGQKIGVRIAKNKNELSATEKKEIIEFTRNYLENTEYPKADKATFTEGLLESFSQKAQKNRPFIEKKTLQNKISSVFVESDGYDNIYGKYLKNPDPKNPVITYLKKQGDLSQSILSGEPFQNSKYVKHFEKAKALYGNEEIARKDTLAKLLQDKNINKSIVATVSGFIALILLAKPIDFFVENILMEKLISPALDKMQETKNQFKQKTKEKAKN